MYKKPGGFCPVYSCLCRAGGWIDGLAWPFAQRLILLNRLFISCPNRMRGKLPARPIEEAAETCYTILNNYIAGRKCGCERLFYTLP